MGQGLHDDSQTGPNKAVEPTPSSVRCAPASRRGSPRALGLRTKPREKGDTA
jgi:hypothetical protein